jgi:hypothetical protein
MPSRLPRWVFRYFTLAGIIAISSSPESKG